MKKLVIFDLDGTLLNTIDDLAVSMNFVLRQYGYQEHKVEEYRYFVGNGITKLVERALPEQERTEAKIIQLRENFIAYYSAHKMDLTRPYDGITDLLADLHHKGIMLAVASNKYHEATRELIRYYFASGIFDVILGQREGFPIKPDPAVVIETMSQTGVEKEEVLYVGDSAVDMQTARNSGVTPVGVAWGFRTCDELKENGAAYIVQHPSEILKLLYNTFQNSDHLLS